MKFPVDILANVSQTELEHLAHNYMTKLLYSDPDAPEHLTLSDSTQVTIDVSSVGFVPLYGSSDQQKILALFSPRDPFTAVALYLLDRWWTVDHILNTADPSARHGAVEVKTIGERIVLYILNRVVYRAKEMSSEEELPFLCHGEKDQAKILWDNGEAVGFYSVKPAGSLCRSFTSRSYELPVMDSIFVRKCHRGKGFGLQMLEDFVLSFKEDSLGLRFPLTKPMYKVCAKFLCQYPGDTELLWEVEGVGMLKQRSKIASKIQAMNLNAVSKSLSFTEETRVIPEATGNDVVLEAITQLKETKSMVEIVEEVTVLRAEKEADLAVTARGRSSGSKKRKMGENIKEDKSEKIIRIEDIEAETPIEEQRNTELHNVSDSEGVFSVDAAGEEDGEDVFDIAPEEEEEEDEAAIISDKTDVTSAPITEEPQVEGDATQDLNNTFLDSQITVENVASEIEEEECHNEGTAVLVVSEDVSEVHKEADNLGKGTQIKVTDEMPEESVTVTEPVVSLLTHATSEDRKSRGAVLKAIQTVQSEPLRRRSRRHRSPEQTPTQEGGRVLRARTAMLTPTPTPKLKHTQHRQKVGGELQKVSTTKAVEELAANNTKEPEEITSINEDMVAVDETHQQEDDENTETQKELGVEDTGVKGGETVTDESEREQKGEEVETSAIQQVVSGDEVEEPPVVQKRAKPKPPPTRRSRRHKDQEEVQTDEADLETGASASEEKADENAMDKHLGEHQVESEETVDKTEEEISPVVEEDIISKAVEAAEDVLPLTEVNGKEQKVEASEQVMEAEKEEEPNDMIQQPDTIVATPETVIADEEVNEAAAPVAEEETQLIELITAEEEKEVSSCDAEKETSNAGVLLEEDPDKEKETCADVDEEKSESEDASVIGSGVLSSPETTEEEIREQVKEEDTNEIEECLEPGVDVEEGKDVAGEEEVEPPPSEGADVEQGEATEEDKVEVVKEDKVSVEVEKTAEAAPMTEEENTVAADDLVEGDADTASLQPPTDTGLLVSSEEQTTTLADEMVAQLPELQRVTVVLVDLNKSHHEVQEEPAEKEEAVEETAPEEEEETRDGTAAEAEPEKAVEQEERLEEKCEDAVTAEGTANDKDTVDEEETVTETRTRRVRKQLVKVTPRRQSSRRRQQEQAEEEQQDASDMEEDEPAVQVRVLRKGRKSAPVTQRSAKKRTRKQVQEEEGAGESTAEEQAEEAQLPIEERDASQQVENVESETGPKDELSGTEESVTQQDVPEEGKTSEDVAVETVPTQETVESEQSISSSDVEGTATGGGPNESIAKDIAAKGISEEEEEAADIEQSDPGSCKTTQRQEEEEEETAEKSTEVDEAAAAETSVQSKETTQTEETQLHKAKPDQEEDKSDEITEERDGEEAAVAQKEIGTEVEMEKVEAEQSVTEQETVEEAVADGQGDTPVKESAETELQRVTVVLVDLNKSHHEVQEEPAEKEEAVEETAPEEEEETRDGTAAEAEPEKAVEQEERLEEKCEDAVTAEGTANDKDTVDEEETVTETRTRRVRKQLVKVTPRRQSSRRRQQEQAEEEQQDASDMEEDEPAVQVRVLRKGRKSAPVTQRSAKKRTRKQVQEEEGAGESTAEEQAEEAQLPIDQGDREKLEERDANQQVENVENVTEQETVEEAVADGQEDTLDEESAETEKVTDEEEAPVVEPAGQIRVLRLGRRSAPATPRRKSKRARTSCQPEEEEKEDSRTEETEGQEGEAGQEVDQEKGEEGKSVEMETEKENDVEEEEVESAVEVGDAELTEEASTDQAETGTDTVEIPPGQAEETNSAEDAEDTAEDQAEEQADPLGEGLVAPAAQEDTESVEEEPSESKADQTVDSSVGEGRSVRRKMDTVADKEHQNRRSVRKIHRVDYRETDEEDGGGQTEAATDKEEEDGVEFSADEPIEEPEESSREGNMGAVESSSEKGDILNLVLDSEDQAETAGSGHDNEEDGQSTSDEEEEPIVIGKRVLRGRSVPSVTITPQSKSRRSSAKVQKAEMSEDEEESHQSSHKRSVHKRKCTEPTPTRKSKRASRV